MIPCPSCACHLRAHETTCPHCGTTMGTTRSRTVAAAVLALTLSGCVGAKTDTVEPEYGVSITGTTGDTGQITEPEYGVTITGTTGDTGTGDTGSTTGVDYGTAP
ncbi:MAG: hypothetical protein ABMA64_22100 [Myxococcota bacterium]